MFDRGISARERRTIVLGIVLTASTLALTYAVIPFARRWHAREQVIATETERLARLRGLVSNEARLQELALARSAALESGQQRLLAGRTPALAASAMQSLLQDFADQSQVSVSRLDVAGEPEVTPGTLPMIPATIAAVGDIHGITSLLSLMQHGALLLDIAELTVRPNPALRGELLQLTVKLHGAYITR